MRLVEVVRSLVRARPSRALTRSAVVVLLVAVAVLGLAAPVAAGDAGSAGSAGDAETGDPARRLAERYAPTVAVRQHPTPCGEGEPYSPAAVESVLGRDDVALVGPDGAVVTTAPTAADLFGLGEGYHLDLPGNPLDPGCDYERWWDAMAADFPPTIYARVATDPGHPGKLVLQYWFWWVFNDWNDKHEGDWEMAQLVFDAETPEDALAVEPELVVFAQHEGGQYVGWDDEELERDGDRMVVFPGAGSHAAYFEADRWFGKSAKSGFGCDDTRAPVSRLEPEVVLLPSQVEDVVGPEDPFAWVAFTGRWGQKAPSFNNGPQGPAAKTSWATPVEWVEDEGRDSAVALPPLGSEVTDFFCTISAEGSLLFIKALDSPVVVTVAVLAVLVALVLAVRATRFRPASTRPVASTRRAGQLLTAAFGLQLRHPAVYGGLGLVVLGGGALASVVQHLVLDLTALGHYSSIADESSTWAVPVALLAGAVVTVPVAAFARAGAAAAVHELAGERAPTFPGVVRRALVPPGGLLASVLLHVMVAVASVVHLLWPIVLWLVARWAVATPAGVAGSLSTGAALRRSSELTRGHRWRTLGVAVLANVLVLVVGPLVGTLLLLTGAGFELVNLVAAVVGMVLVPWAGTVLALLREDLLCRSRGDAGAEPAPAPSGLRSP